MSHEPASQDDARFWTPFKDAAIRYMQKPSTGWPFLVLQPLMMSRNKKGIKEMDYMLFGPMESFMEHNERNKMWNYIVVARPNLAPRLV